MPKKLDRPAGVHKPQRIYIAIVLSTLISCTIYFFKIVLELQCIAHIRLTKISVLRYLLSENRDTIWAIWPSIWEIKLTFDSTQTDTPTLIYFLFLKLLDTYASKIAKICNFWTFRLVIQLIKQLFKIWQKVHYLVKGFDGCSTYLDPPTSLWSTGSRAMSSRTRLSSSAGLGSVLCGGQGLNLYPTCNTLLWRSGTFYRRIDLLKIVRFTNC